MKLYEYCLCELCIWLYFSGKEGVHGYKKTKLSFTIEHSLKAKLLAYGGKEWFNPKEGGKEYT